jgi:phosphonate transport system substrate-binding protein
LLIGLAFFLLAEVSFGESINIGTVGTVPTDEIKNYLPFANYLARQLQSEGYDRGKVVVARSIPEMVNFLREGKVDLYIDSPFPIVAASRLSGSKFLALREKHGLKEYRSIIFVRRDSGILRLQDLNGKVIAFKEPFSSSAYFVPKIIMVQQGLKLVLKKGAADPVAPGEVGYVFTNDNENTLAWVRGKKAAAGALDNQVYDNEARANLDTLQVLHQSFSFPRHIVSHRASLTHELVEKIKLALFQMHRSEEGKKALDDFQKTSRFDEVPSQALAPFLNAAKLIDAEFAIK